MLAQGQPPAQGNPLTLLVPMMVVLGVFMWLQARSQKKKAQQHKQMMDKLKAGDRVLASCGIVGTVANVKDKTITVRTAGDTKLEFTKGSIAEIIEGGSDAGQA